MTENSISLELSSVVDYWAAQEAVYQYVSNQEEHIDSLEESSPEWALETAKLRAAKNLLQELNSYSVELTEKGGV